MTHRDYLWCVLNLMLDDEEELERLCPACRARAEEERCPVCGARTGRQREDRNLSFDPERFQRLKRGERA